MTLIFLWFYFRVLHEVALAIFFRLLVASLLLVVFLFSGGYRTRSQYAFYGIVTKGTEYSFSISLFETFLFKRSFETGFRFVIFTPRLSVMI